MLEVMSMKGSLEMVRTAGIESIANIRSDISTTTNATSIGVACRIAFFFTKNCSFFNSGLKGMSLPNSLTPRFFSIFIFFSSFLRSILRAAYINSAPKMYIINWNLSSSVAPTRSNGTLSKIAVKIPTERTLCW